MPVTASNKKKGKVMSLLTPQRPALRAADLLQTVHRIFCICCALIFSWLFLGVLFENKIYNFNTLAVIFSILCWLVATVYLYRALNRHEALLIRWEKHIIAVIMAVVFTVQLNLGYWLAVETSWDTEAVYRGAVNLSLHGNLGNYREYFHIFPHNLGATALLGWLFSAGAAVGVEDLYWIGTVYNVISLTLGVWLVYGIARELKDVKHGLLALWFVVTCLPLQFYTPVFYTDTLSLPFVAGVYYFYLRLLKQDVFHKRLLLGLLVGALCALGALMKFSAAIVAIAILADLVLRQQLWRQRYSVVAALVIFFILLKSFTSYRDNHLLDERYSDLKRVPHAHWVMMGLKGNGSYNSEDYTFTYRFRTYEQRQNANLVQIRQRIADYGFWGYLEFLNRKQQLNFGSGIYGVPEMIDDNPLRPNALHQFVLDGERYFDYFKIVAQGHHVLLFLLIIWGMWYDAVTRNRQAVTIFAARTAVLGIYLFLLLWEANSRYVFNFIPLFVICAAYSFPYAYRTLAALRQAFLEVLRPIDEQEAA